MIDRLTTDDFGRWVVYTDGEGHRKKGRIKDFNNESGHAFVVFECKNNWRDFQYYPAARVRLQYLQFAADVKVKKELPGQLGLL